MPVRSVRPRVAYFVPPSKHFAGIERVVHEIASGLAQTHGDRVDIHVVFASHYEEQLLHNTSYTQHVLGVERLRQLGASLRRCVADQRFDILICPQVEASVIAWIATRGLGLPVFVPHLHGNPQIEEADGTRRTRAAFAFFRHVVSRRVKTVLTVSPSLRSYAAKSIARHADVFFVKDPVRDLGEPGPPAEGDDRFRFVNVGRLSRQKGQDILLRALAIARPDLPPVLVTLVGDGPEEASLKQLCHELGLDDVVVFAGYVSDPTAHLRSADCFVLSSRWEGFGVVLIEALQCGLPLLATDCDFGPGDVITDPAIGTLVSPEDPRALAEGLKQAVSRKADAQDVSRRLVAARAYSPSEAVATHFSILEDVLLESLPSERSHRGPTA